MPDYPKFRDLPRTMLTWCDSCGNDDSETGPMRECENCGESMCYRCYSDHLDACYYDSECDENLQ